MKKISLLATSVAIALAGCGGGGDDSAPTSSSGSNVITGFDGYFHQAVAFQDTNNDGKLNINTLGQDGGDIIFGLTDIKGQVAVPKKIEGALALQTLTPSGAIQQALIAHDHSYAGKYTIDMDHPAQAMAHEVVFRAPVSSNVISPITDLVAIEMVKNNGDQAAAEETVTVALGGTNDAPIALYDDFISGENANAELHKTAQILTESKAANPNSYEDKSRQFAEEADRIVDDIVADPTKNIEDKDLKPVIIDNGTAGSFVPKVVTNYKLVVSQDKLNALQTQIPELAELGTFGGITLDVSGLFKDTDQSDIAVTVDNKIPTETGITVTLVGTTITLSASDFIDESGEFEITLTANDLNSESTEVGSASATLKLKIEAANLYPKVDFAEYARLQAIINNWDLQVGVPFEQTLNIENLFTDEDGDIVSFRTGAMTIPGLTVSPQESDNPIITISGTPIKATAQDSSEAFMVGGVDDQGDPAYQEMLMPKVAEGVTPEPNLHPLEGKTWYRLDHGSSDGTIENNYSSIWCDSIRFEDNVIYGNQRTGNNLTSCSVADTPIEDSSYVIEDGTLVATFNGFEDGAPFTETLAIEMKGSADDISSGAQTVVYRNTSDKSGERYTYFSSKADTEKRLTIKSDVGPAGRSFGMYLPAEQYPNYDLSRITVSMTDYVASHDNNVMDANVFFDIDNKDFTCKEVQEFFYQFEFTGKDIGTVVSTDWDGSPIECFTGEEDSGPNGAIIKHAAVDFDLPALTVGNVYSIIGRVKESQGEYIEAVKFNIEWTGTGDTE
ncbi:hypothetical protein [Vibrio nereis]|uniref:hypothetical protein n=1 Tax=Vibrio nereis TaxID=693 RepID=UPI0024943FA7|nr:hypothetical protein [Vibrio nereis]